MRTKQIVFEEDYYRKRLEIIEEFTKMSRIIIMALTFIVGMSFIKFDKTPLGFWYGVILVIAFGFLSYLYGYELGGKDMKENLDAKRSKK